MDQIFFSGKTNKAARQGNPTIFLRGIFQQEPHLLSFGIDVFRLSSVETKIAGNLFREKSPSKLKEIVDCCHFPTVNELHTQSCSKIYIIQKPYLTLLLQGTNEGGSNSTFSTVTVDLKVRGPFHEVHGEQLRLSLS